MKYLLILLFSFSASAALNEVDRSEIFSKNLLKNGGFESGKALWTASAGSFAVTTSSPMIGLQHATWDAAASGNTLTSTAVTIKPGMYGRNMVASCLFTTASGTATHEIQAYDGSNVLAEATITSSTTPARASVNFIGPSSGSISLRVYANADEPSVAIDDCYLGPAEGYNIANVSQASFYGEVVWPGAASCTWSVTASATPTAFGADSDCTLPTGSNVRGNASDMSGASKVPSILLNNMPPGIYEVVLTGFPYDASTTVACGFYFNDGSTTEYAGAVFSGGSNFAASPVLRARFRYTNTASRTIQVYATGLTGSAACNIYNATTSISDLKFTVYKYPIESDITYTPDKVANSWSGYHDSTCSWARTGTSLADPAADASCALTTNYNTNFGTVTSVDSGGSALPGITFTPSRVGKYYACASFFVVAGASGQSSAQLLAGSDVVTINAGTNPSTNALSFRLCGIVNASSTSAINLKIQTAAQSGSTTIQSASPATHAIDWSIFQIDQSFPAPLIANSVVSSSSGVMRQNVANINCDSGSAITSQLGSWVSSVGNVSGGACSITLNSGIFSSAPYCFVSPNAAFASVGLILSIASSSSTALSVDCEDDASSACTSYDFNLFCVGQP